MGFKTKHLQGEEVKMADNVSFKVYLKDPSQGEETEVRRFVVDKEVSTSLGYIKEKLVSIFPVLADKIFSISWTDEDGDSITIDTDEELILALTELPGPVYKLTATVRAAKKVEEPQEPGVGANMTHPGVTCDGCDKAPIVGFRYKCVVCCVPQNQQCGDPLGRDIDYDYDLVGSGLIDPRVKPLREEAAKRTQKAKDGLGLRIVNRPNA